MYNNDNRPFELRVRDQESNGQVCVETGECYFLLQEVDPSLKENYTPSDHYYLSLT
jgi:hypothetical protein